MKNITYNFLEAENWIGHHDNNELINIESLERIEDYYNEHLGQTITLFTKIDNLIHFLRIAADEIEINRGNLSTDEFAQKHPRLWKLSERMINLSKYYEKNERQFENTLDETIYVLKFLSTISDVIASRFTSARIVTLPLLVNIIYAYEKAWWWEATPEMEAHYEVVIQEEKCPTGKTCQNLRH